MYLIFIIFLTTASCATVPIFENNNAILPEYSIHDRIKRDINIKNIDSKYNINFDKDLINNDDKKLSVFGSIDALDKNSYGSIKTGLDFKNTRGDSLDLSAIHTKEESKISGQGELNIIKTDTQNLNTKAFGEKDIFGKDSLYKFGGALDYNNKKGDSINLEALKSNTETKYTGVGHLNLMKTDTQNLGINAYGERTSKGNDVHNKLEGVLEYINKNGNNLFLTAKQDSDVGKEFIAKGKYTIIDKPNHSLDAQGFWDKIIPKGNSPIEAYGGSLNYLNGKGDSASFLAKHTSDFGDELAASGKFNVFHNDKHNLDVTGSLSRSFPIASNPYNTYSANLDYLYKDKFTANLGAKHSDLFDKTDFSGLGKLHLFNDKNSNLDIFGGVSRSMSPKFDTGFQPNFGISYGINF